MAKNTLDGKRKLVSPSHIIGVGASAGGMEAIHDLFEYMPGNTGFSFVVIQHLSPDHKSLMGELLAKHTSMQVREATEDMVIEPDCIYVIPNNKFLTIRKGRLQLDEKLKSRLPALQARQVMVTHMNPTVLARVDELRQAGVLVAEDGLVHPF